MNSSMNVPETIIKVKVVDSPAKPKKTKLSFKDQLISTALNHKKPFCQNLVAQMKKNAKAAAAKGQFCIEFCYSNTVVLADHEIEYIYELLDKTGIDYDYKKNSNTFSLSWG